MDEGCPLGAGVVVPDCSFAGAFRLGPVWPGGPVSVGVVVVAVPVGLLAGPLWLSAVLVGLDSVGIGVGIAWVLVHFLGCPVLLGAALHGHLPVLGVAQVLPRFRLGDWPHGGPLGGDPAWWGPCVPAW